VAFPAGLFFNPPTSTTASTRLGTRNFAFFLFLSRRFYSSRQILPFISGLRSQTLGPLFFFLLGFILGWQIWFASTFLDESRFVCPPFFEGASMHTPFLFQATLTVDAFVTTDRFPLVGGGVASPPPAASIARWLTFLHCQDPPGAYFLGATPTPPPPPNFLFFGSHLPIIVLNGHVPPPPHFSLLVR